MHPAGRCGLRTRCSVQFPPHRKTSCCYCVRFSCTTLQQVSREGRVDVSWDAVEAYWNPGQHFNYCLLLCIMEKVDATCSLRLTVGLIKNENLPLGFCVSFILRCPSSFVLPCSCFSNPGQLGALPVQHFASQLYKFAGWNKPNYSATFSWCMPVCECPCCIV